MSTPIHHTPLMLNKNVDRKPIAPLLAVIFTEVRLTIASIHFQK